jgi:3-oxoacyl-[acyl-carrier-protein] synthase-3
MAISKLENCRITGIVSAVPKRLIGNDDFRYLFSDEELQKMKKMTGIETRRYVEEDTCTSDLCEAAALRLLDLLGWDAQSVDALIFISQTPDYILPATSCILQNKLGLPSHCAAFDVNLGCSGYGYGLWLASSLISSRSANRVLLLVGDTITKSVSPNDKSTCFLFGDAGTATAIEYSEQAQPSFFILGTDGAGEKNLIIPAGGFRNPNPAVSSSRTDQVVRNEYELYMDGTEIFNFTLERVPNLIQDLLAFSGSEHSQVNQYVFHQANEFILRHIAKKLKIDMAKVPISIGQFGNTSSASIPLTICSELKNSALKDCNKAVLVGFGVGYSWAAAEVDLSGLRCNEWMEV